MLIKHGEDVRQDERIMQLLNTINIALLRDQQCRKRNLQIRTYEVSCLFYQLFITSKFLLISVNVN